MNPVQNSNLKRKFEEGDLPQVKVPRLGTISDTIDKIHEVAELSGKDLRLPETIQKLNELVQSLLREDARSESLGKDLNVIYQRLDVNQPAQKEVASKIGQIIHKDFSLQAISKDYGLSSDRGTVLALYASKEISISTIRRLPGGGPVHSLHLDEVLYRYRMTPAKEIFSITPRLAAQLTDERLEAIFKYSESDKLKLIEGMNLSFADFPLLGERAIGLFLKYCPNMEKETFTNLPDNLCNQKLFEKGSTNFLNVNRDLLMAYSDTFKTMWESGLKESTKSEKTEILDLDDSFQASFDLTLTDKWSKSFKTYEEFEKIIHSYFPNWFKKYGEVMNINFVYSVVVCLDYHQFKDHRKKIDQLIAHCIRQEYKNIVSKPNKEDMGLLCQMLDKFAGDESRLMSQLLANLLAEKYSKDNKDVIAFIEKYSGNELINKYNEACYSLHGGRGICFGPSLDSAISDDILDVYAPKSNLPEIRQPSFADLGAGFDIGIPSAPSFYDYVKKFNGF